MQILTVSVKTEETKDKILWFLKHLKKEGVEIISQEDMNDLHLLMASRNDKNVSFAQYLKNVVDTKIAYLEKKQRDGYSKHPVKSGEFDDLENE